MRFFQISLLFILVTSCSSVTKNYLLQNKNTKAKIQNNYFSDSEKDYVYKAKINIYGNYIGGIAIVKRLEKNHHRIVFTTEFGVKILDIELKDNTLIKNKVIKKLDRKIILNTLKKDFHILLQEDANVLETYTFEENVIYKTPNGQQFNLYFFNGKNQLVKIVNASKHKEKVEILFSNFKKHTPKSISINHKNIKLIIDLTYLK